MFFVTLQNFCKTFEKILNLRNLSSKMLPKYHVRMHHIRPSNPKRNRSPNKTNVSISQTPKPVEKKVTAETMGDGCLNDSMEILPTEIIGHGSDEDGAKWQRPAVQNIGDAFNAAFEEDKVSKEIIGKVTASCNADSDVGKITLELVKVLVPAVTESVKTTVQKTVTESLLQFSKMEEKNIKKFEGKVNSSFTCEVRT